MQIGGRQAPEGYGSVLDELHILTENTPRNPDQSFVEALVASRHLQKEGEVWWVEQGVHGIIYVSTRHTQRGRPIAGRQYSLFLFDPYRRTYKFDGKANALCEKWQATVLQRGEALYNDGLRELEGLVAEQKRKLERASSDDERQADEEDLQKVKAALSDTQQRFTQERPAQIAAIRLTGATAAQELQRLRGSVFPSIDIFFRQLAASLANNQTYMPPMQLVHDMYDLLRHCNGVKSLEGREIWPLFENDSWRCTTDNYFGIRLDNLLRKGTSTAFTSAQVLLWQSREATRNDGPRVTPGRHAIGDFLYKRMCKRVQLSVSHAALREAFRSHRVACWYFDERVQRGIAVREKHVSRLPENVAAGQLQHDTMARRAAVEALRVQIPIRDAALAKQVRRQRRAQRHAMEAKTGFAVFANAPWKVGTAEATALREKHFCFFKSIPRKKHDTRFGNCNTIAAALLKHAEAVEKRSSKRDAAKTVFGRWRTFGRKRELALPQCPP